MISGLRRPVAEAIEELASRNRLNVAVGPTGDRTITYQIGPGDPEDALQGLARMSGLDVRFTDDVWYVGTPDWLQTKFSDPTYTMILQSGSDQASSWAGAFQRLLSPASSLQAAGDSQLIVTAPLRDLEFTASVLDRSARLERFPLTASAIVEATRPDQNALYRTIKSAGVGDVELEKPEGSRAAILHGDPLAVAASLRLYQRARRQDSAPSPLPSSPKPR
jgi:hypothetical protein